MLDLPHGELLKLVSSRARRRFRRGLKEKPKGFIQRLRKAKKACAGTIKKPKIIKTHLRHMIIVPEMVAAQIGVYNGKGYILVEVKVCVFVCFLMRINVCILALVYSLI